MQQLTPDTRQVAACGAAPVRAPGLDVPLRDINELAGSATLGAPLPLAAARAAPAIIDRYRLSDASTRRRESCVPVRTTSVLSRRRAPQLRVLATADGVTTSGSCPVRDPAAAPRAPLDGSEAPSLASARPGDLITRRSRLPKDCRERRSPSTCLAAVRSGRHHRGRDGRAARETVHGELSTWHRLLPPVAGS